MPQCEVTGAGFVCIYPLLTSCVSLGGPGPMHSFSEWEKLLQTRYKTQSVVCAMMWQLATIHGSPMVCPYLLAICNTTHRQSKQHPTNRVCHLTVTLRQGLHWLELLLLLFLFKYHKRSKPMWLYSLKFSRTVSQSVEFGKLEKAWEHTRCR